MEICLREKFIVDQQFVDYVGFVTDGCLCYYA